MNKVDLQGRISSIYSNEYITNITLAVRKGSMFNYPTITFYKNEKPMSDSYKKGDYVHILGHISVRGMKNNDNVRYMQQFVRGELIYLVKNEMTEKFLRDLSGHYEYINEFLIDGTLLKKDVKDSITTITLQPHNEKFFIWLRSYAKNSSWLDQYKENDELCIKGMIQTNRRSNQYGKQYYENYIIEYSSASDPIPPEQRELYDLLNILIFIQ